MMNDFMLDMALGHFGFDEQQKARIVASIPKWAYAAHLLKNNKTVLNELIDIFDLVAQQINKQGTQ